ncbi:protein POF1B isoform X2 [Girardinichthys multiradiatus]|nr:protein POF1B isoform X2 [Girardinichthys multiradiatus]
MSVHTTQQVRTYRTLTPEPVATQMFTTRSMSPVSPLTQVSPVSPLTQVSPVSPLTQVSSVSTGLPVTTVNGSYESMRYMVPVQQSLPQQSYVMMQQPMMQQAMMQPMMQQARMLQARMQPMMQQAMMQPMMQQAMMQPMMQQATVQPMMSQVYLQTLPRQSTNSNHETEILLQQQQQQRFSVEHDSQSTHSVFSQSSSPSRSEASLQEEQQQEEEEQVELEDDQHGTVEIEEVEIVNVFQQKAPSVRHRVSLTEQKEVLEPTKLDTRYFGELLADIYRKNCDIHSYISENVSKIRGQKHSWNLSSEITKGENQDVESLIPKGATELTKQQMRYLLQTRFTAEKSMRLLLSTFSSLREELMQMSEDMRRLEIEKESLERDLNFKADQARQYDSLLEAVRENNRQLQLSLREASTAQRSLESQVISSRDNDSASSFKIKELDGRMRALEKENEMLKQKLAGQASNGNLQLKTEALAQHYNDQLQTLKTERDMEIEKLRSQISKLQTQITTTTTTTTKSSSDSTLQLKISELLAKLEQREITINQKEEEIQKLMKERNDSSKNVTKTIITKRYRNQYPLLGLLGDDYQVTSPVKEDKTIIIERTGQIIKQE